VTRCSPATDSASLRSDGGSLAKVNAARTNTCARESRMAATARGAPVTSHAEEPP
jgi:hypothetical protein